MLGRTYETHNSSAARALEIAGECWSLLIIRHALFRGATRFGDFQRSLGVTRNILVARRDRFVEVGVMERRPSAALPRLCLDRHGPRTAARHRGLRALGRPLGRAM